MKAIHKIDASIEKALKYWLRIDVPFSSLVVELKARVFLRAEVLSDLGQSLNEAGIESSIGLRSGRLTPSQFAEEFSKLFCLYRNEVAKTHYSDLEVEVENGSSYENWIREEGSKDTPSYILQLRKIAQGSVPLIRSLLIHGSVATHDQSKGFSDLDTAVLIRDDTLSSPEGMMGLRSIMSKIICCTLQHDPDMHHGPYLLWESRLNHYRNEVFPLLLYKYGMELVSNRGVLHAKPMEDRRTTCNAMAALTGLLDRWRARSPIVRNRFEIEWLMGSVMLLPALYLQAKTGEFMYKKYTFELARRDFSESEWRPVEVATEIRRNLPKRTSPPAFVSALAWHLNMPRIIIGAERDKGESRRVARETDSNIPDDFVSEAYSLALKMYKSSCQAA